MKSRRLFLRLVIFVCLTLLITTATLACADPDAYRSDLTSAEVMARVLSAIPADGGYRPADAGYVCASSFGDGLEDLFEETQDFCIMLAEAEDTNINELGIFRVKEQDDVYEVASVVGRFLQGQQERYAGLLAAYQPTEIPKLEAAELKIYGKYVFYSILSADVAATARAACEKALKE